MTKEKLVVIGNGMAPGKVLETLLEEAPDRYDIIIFNAETRVNYNRIMLSPVLTGESEFEEIVIHGDGWYIENNITLYKGHKIVEIDKTAKTVTSEHGVVQAYDKLVIATGSYPFIIPVPGHKLAGVLTFRDLDDVHAMMLAARRGGKAVVIGGGLLGLEAAAGLQIQGMDVTVLHLMPTLMERQLDESAGYLLEKELQSRGINIITKANTKEILGETKVEGVLLDDGTVLDATIVIMAVGIRPNLHLAKDSGFATERGILVDETMQTSDPDVFSVGECIQFDNRTYGLVAPLYDQAKVLGKKLAGKPTDPFVHSESATKLKVTGVNLFSAGDFASGDDRQEIVLRDAAKGVYKRLILQDDKIIGVVLYGETADGPWFYQMLKEGEDISEMRDSLIFGAAYAGGGGSDPLALVAGMSDGAEICGCNGVDKGTIVNAITKDGLCTLEEVRACTKASASCGSCSGLVEQLLALTLGDSFDASAVKPICGCSDLGHQDVRRMILSQELKSIPAIMQALEWKTSCGCAKCRPALNYYLVCAWPDEYVDDGFSRFINERVHANIQKDGTYSVIPRMWGGVTTPSELRAIADVADKFEISIVKVTGGQRIDLLGVKKEDLTAVWADLNDAGMVSGHAYAKGLRTVKTCVGTDWCRVATQDSTGLGIQLEKAMWGAWAPHKLKLAVSGCPRNCSESTCKDIGVICIDSGYELHFGGAAGMHIQGTQVLCTVGTEAEVKEHIFALTQMYREQADYLDRIYKWADKVGYDYIRSVIVEDAGARKAYSDKFLFSQTFMQDDPWKERVDGKEAHHFGAPLIPKKIAETV
ncbi:MAG: nitrite reductase large subunit [Robiginitomaculum sp.]|nr:MAG: nitrite reductase large subunit [Robiginitomaculum sp.]